MGKSLGNFITLKQVFSDAPDEKHDRLSRKYDPLAVRQLVLNSHYRSPLDFSDEALHAAQSGYEKITDAVINLRQRLNIAPKGQLDERVSEQLRQLQEQFETAMNDDLNTAVALSVIFELVRLANKLLESNATAAETLDAVDKKFRKLGGECLGIVKEHYGQAAIDVEMIDNLVKILIGQRNAARKQKDFAAADVIRLHLDKIGIVLEDRPDGTTWRWK
jgi:cysteinyl-tRNA synthetase